jgi:hypothetical protein
LPSERDAFGIDVAVEEVTRSAHPRIAHLAEGRPEARVRRPFEEGGVEIERLAGIRVRQSLVRRAGIGTLRRRGLHLGADGIVHASDEPGAQADPVSITFVQGEFLVDRLVPVAQIALPLEAPHPVADVGLDLRDRVGRLVGRFRLRLLLPLELLDLRLQRVQLSAQRLDLRGALCGGTRCDHRQSGAHQGRHQLQFHGSFAFSVLQSFRLRAASASVRIFPPSLLDGGMSPLSAR